MSEIAQLAFVFVQMCFSIYDCSIFSVPNYSESSPAVIFLWRIKCQMLLFRLIALCRLCCRLLFLFFIRIVHFWFQSFAHSLIKSCKTRDKTPLLWWLLAYCWIVVMVKTTKKQRLTYIHITVKYLNMYFFRNFQFYFELLNIFWIRWTQWQNWQRLFYYRGWILWTSRNRIDFLLWFVFNTCIDQLPTVVNTLTTIAESV